MNIQPLRTAPEAKESPAVALLGVFITLAFFFVAVAGFRALIGG
jgi:hypothetical protein